MEASQKVRSPRRKSLVDFVFFVVICHWLAMVSCQRATTNAEPALTRAAMAALAPESTAMAQPATPAATETVALLPVATTVPTPTSTASPTSIPVAVLAVPPDWLEVATLAVAQLNQNGSNWQWQLVGGDDTAGVLSSGQTGVAVVEGRDGTLIRQRPLVLAVPFTTEWESVTAEEAQSILSEGHSLVQVMPWSEMPPTHKALRVEGRLPDDPDYPLQEGWSLVAAPGYESAMAELAPVLQANAALEPVVRLAAVGDIMLDRTLGAVLQQGKLEHPFVYVPDVLRGADITVGNLESALGDVGQPAAKSYAFRAPPQAAAALALAGFDVVSLANNHGMDYGPEALLQGLSLLREQGIGTIGAGASEAEAHAAYVTEIDGLTLAFLGYVHVPVEARGNFDTASWTAVGDAPGLAWGDPDKIQADVAAIRPQVDLVIVVLHSGYEYVEAPSPPQVAAAKAAIDAGADLVIGHHAHILQGVDFYNDGVIVYGLGNFAFVIDGPPETAILNVWLDREGVRQLEIVPAVIQSGGQPRLAEPWEAAAIRQRVYQLSRLLGTP